MSTLKVNKLRDTAGSADAITLDPNGGAVLAGVTTMTTARVTSGIVTNTFIVGAGVTISESGIEASGIGITCANINGTQIGGRRNIIHNGAMNVAQRGSAATTEQLYQTVDRMRLARNGCDENPSQEQLTLSTGTDAYASGFKKAYKITNGNQTSGAGSGDSIGMSYRVEAGDIRTSGWDYTNPNSFITLQFWVISSVGQTFYGRLRSLDGTSQNYIFSYTLSANTWTKIIKTVPGNSNIQFDDDVNQGLQIVWSMFTGTNSTDSGVSLNTWGAYDSNAQYPDNTTTWFTTNDATWSITGIQLEVGSQATPFEHRSFGEELILCQRYYQQYVNPCCTGVIPDNGSKAYSIGLQFQTRMRVTPTTTITNAGTGGNVSDGQSTQTIASLNAADGNVDGMSIYLNLNGDLGDFRPACLGLNDSTTNTTTYKFTADI